MSARVQRLDPTTAGRIAAGEVIERPASVVKELVDNAIDAASTRIDIELRNGGRRLIQVTDNGAGMYPEEAALALQRFTTSKIRYMEDLARLTTLGFRGEALPSLAAVAEVEMATRPADRQEGVLVRSNAEAQPSVQPCGCSVGTRVRVQRLFTRIPVRLNALRSIAREVRRIHELVAHYALAYPQTTFHLRHDDRRLLFAPACADLTQRLSVMFDRELTVHMLPVHWQSVDLMVYGAVSAPALNRATRQRQYFWVNGRPVRSGLLGAALARPYGALLPPGRYPLAALGIALPPQLLDVNVHPRKTEITFLHERAVFAAVQEAVETVLQRLTSRDLPWEEEAPQAWTTLPLSAPGVAESVLPYGEDAPPPPTPWHLMGQIGHTFIVAGGPEGLVLLDQHAAHESVLYTRLMAADEAGVELSEPFLLTLTPSQQRWFAMCQPALVALGLAVETFGPGTVLVRSVPAVLADMLRPGNFLEAVQEAMQRVTSRATPEEVREQLGAALACRTAIRAGDRLAEEHVTMLVEMVAQQRLPYTCPHGRPTYVTLSLADLERRFMRLFPLDTSAGGC